MVCCLANSLPFGRTLHLVSCWEAGCVLVPPLAQSCEKSGVTTLIASSPTRRHRQSNPVAVRAVRSDAYYRAAAIRAEKAPAGRIAVEDYSELHSAFDGNYPYDRLDRSTEYVADSSLMPTDSAGNAGTVRRVIRHARITRPPRVACGLGRAWLYGWSPKGTDGCSREMLVCMLLP